MATRARAPARTRRTASASRATRSARGRREFGVGLARSWKRANYAYPGGAGPDRGKRPSYPIDPLARSAQRRTAGTASHVRWAVRQRYGSIPRALAAARRAGR